METQMSDLLANPVYKLELTTNLPHLAKILVKNPSEKDTFRWVIWKDETGFLSDLDPETHEAEWTLDLLQAWSFVEPDSARHLAFLLGEKFGTRIKNIPLKSMEEYPAAKLLEEYQKTCPEQY